MNALRLLMRPLSIFHRNHEGFAATEFAMLAPIMILLYFGAAELTDAFIVDTRVTRIASTAADLVAQDDEITDVEIASIFNALDTIMFPYDASTTAVVISSLVDDGNGVAKVEWSDAHNGTARALDSSVPVPQGMMAGGGSVIYAEVSHDYSSSTGKIIYGTIQLTDEFYLRPRRAVKVERE